MFEVADPVRFTAGVGAAVKAAAEAIAAAKAEAVGEPQVLEVVAVE